MATVNRVATYNHNTSELSTTIEGVTVAEFFFMLDVKEGFYTHNLIDPKVIKVEISKPKKEKDGNRDIVKITAPIGVWNEAVKCSNFAHNLAQKYIQRYGHAPSVDGKVVRITKKQVNMTNVVEFKKTAKVSG